MRGSSEGSVDGRHVVITSETLEGRVPFHAHARGIASSAGGYSKSPDLQSVYP